MDAARKKYDYECPNCSSCRAAIVGTNGVNQQRTRFAKMDYTPTPVSSSADLLEIFEKAYCQGRDALSTAKEEDLLPEWTLRNGGQV